MIIVEGTDLVGKTTLCKKICTYLNKKADEKYGVRPEYLFEWRYAHMSAHNKSFDFHWGYVSLMHPRNVQDRFHLSLLAYDAAQHVSPPRINSAELASLQGKLKAIGCLTIVITADEELIKKRYTETKRDEMFNLNTILKANEFFCRGDLGQDISYPCNSFRPFVPDEKVAAWCDEYLETQISLAHMNRRKLTHTI